MPAQVNFAQLTVLILVREAVNSSMNWQHLTSLEELNGIKNRTGFSIIFKHSTRCSISLMAKKKLELESSIIPADIPAYYLDLLNYREISNAITEVFQVPHQSPQILLINNGECIFEATHGEISAEELAEQIA